MKFLSGKALLIWHVAISLCFLISCSRKEEEVPEHVFSRDSMVMIMARIHIAEALLNQYGSQTNQIDFKAAYLQKLILDNGIDTARFNTSFDFYATRPELFAGVYDDVINEISRQQAIRKGK